MSNTTPGSSDLGVFYFIASKNGCERTESLRPIWRRKKRRQGQEMALLFIILKIKVEIL